MDETPTTHDMPNNQTVAGVGEAQYLWRLLVPWKDAFHHCTILPGWKHRTLPSSNIQEENYPKKTSSSITVCVYPKGWLDKQGTKLWLHDVWVRRPGARSRKCLPILQVDWFAHLELSIKSSIKFSYYCYYYCYYHWDNLYIIMNHRPKCGAGWASAVERVWCAVEQWLAH